MGGIRDGIQGLVREDQHALLFVLFSCYTLFSGNIRIRTCELTCSHMQTQSHSHSYAQIHTQSYSYADRLAVSLTDLNTQKHSDTQIHSVRLIYLITVSHSHSDL